MQLDLIDVFAARHLGGNPLAVVRFDDPDEADLSDEAMQELTRWLGFSETTFLLPPEHPDADYRVRIFYPAGELPFAGHPTLGSAYAWLAAGGVPQRPGVIVQECGIGLVEVRGDTVDVPLGWPLRLAFRAPPLIRKGELTLVERAEAVRLMGINSRCVVDAVHAANGPPWQLLRLRSAEDVLSAEGSTRALKPHTDIGLVGPWASDDERSGGAQWEVRGFFSSPAGIMTEDPVTGSLNAAIALYLFETGLATDDYIAAQGRCLGGDGRVYVARDEAGDAWIGGDVAMVAQGGALSGM